MSDRCSLCELEFNSEQEYLDHVCATTGFMPTEPQHQGQSFQQVAEAALSRGFERASVEEKERIETEVGPEGKGEPGALDAVFVDAPAITVDPETSEVIVTPPGEEPPAPKASSQKQYQPRGNRK